MTKVCVLAAFVVMAVALTVPAGRAATEKNLKCSILSSQYVGEDSAGSYVIVKLRFTNHRSQRTHMVGRWVASGDSRGGTASTFWKPLVRRPWVAAHAAKTLQALFTWPPDFTGPRWSLVSCAALK